MLGSIQAVDAQCKWGEWAATVVGRTRQNRELQSPVLSSVCSTCDAASECSLAHDSEAMDDCYEKQLEWQSLSGRLAFALRNRAQTEHGELHEVGSTEKWQYLKECPSALQDCCSQDVDQELEAASAPLQDLSGHTQEWTGWQSLNQRMAVVFQQRLLDDDIAHQAAGWVDHWHAMGSRLLAQLQGVAGEHVIEEAKVEELECHGREETSELQMWKDVCCRMDGVFRRLEFDKLERDDDSSRDYERTCSDCEGDLSPRQLDCSADEQISPERWQKVGSRLAIIFRQALADECAEIVALG